MTTRRLERTLLAAVVLALHAVLLWAWPRPDRSPRASAPQVVVVTVPISNVPEPIDSPPAALLAAPSRTDARARRPAAVAVAEPRSSAAPASAAVPDAEVPRAAAAASQPLDLRLRPPSAMARRGGLTEPAGSMRAQALNDPRSNNPPDARQHLPDAVAASAKGDCLKGEYAGWGMGLLSVPFLAYHAAVGNCKPVR